MRCGRPRLTDRPAARVLKHKDDFGRAHVVPMLGICTYARRKGHWEAEAPWALLRVRLVP